MAVAPGIERQSSRSPESSGQRIHCHEAVGGGEPSHFAPEASTVAPTTGVPATTGRSIPLRTLGQTAPGAKGEVVVGPGDQADLRVSDLPSNGRDFYEIWLLGDDGLVSLGSFRVGPDGAANVRLALPVNPKAYQSFDVSLEPDDGNPGHSGDSVLRGPA